MSLELNPESPSGHDESAPTDLPMGAGRGEPLEEVAERDFSTAEPRKILFVITTSEVGGTESFLARLVSRLDRTLFSPVVCSLCPVGGVGRGIADTGTPVISLEMSASARPWEMLRGSLRLADTLTRLRIDLVQALLYRANVMGALACRLSRRHPVMVAGQRSLTPMTGPSASLAQRLTRPWIRHTVAVSDAVKERLMADEGVPGDHITVIDNGVDTTVFRPSDAATARQALGLDFGGLLLGAVGRLTQVKGIPHLLAAVASLHGRGADIRLALVGDGPERAALEEQARSLGLGDRVHFLGLRRDLPEIFPAFDIFCLPSIREGSPQVLLEAMSAGRPVVATRAGGIPEVVEHGISGLLVDPGSDEQLTEALGRLVEDEALRANLGPAARQRVQDRFDLARGVRTHEDLYRSLLDF